MDALIDSINCSARCTCSWGRWAKNMRPSVNKGLLIPGRHIKDLCSTKFSTHFRDAHPFPPTFAKERARWPCNSASRSIS